MIATKLPVRNLEADIPDDFNGGSAIADCLHQISNNDHLRIVRASDQCSILNAQFSIQEQGTEDPARSMN
jgi:hypothetical protein